ncbi:MAG: hypothetical protein QOD40_1509 [Alphaproteobacteria bacterium]|nr:hypothetical protein [Alphaproteobacteria bacterium]
MSATPPLPGYSQRTWSRDEICDWAAVLVLFIVAALAALTFRDYGLGWDDYTHAQYGELLLAFYGSGFTDQRAMSFVNLEMYGGGFDMAAALLAKILPLGLFETRRLAGAAVGLIGLFVTWRLGRRVGGPLAGLIALVLLATCPLYVGHMFMNPKDAPFATAMATLLLGLVRAFEEYPRPRAGTVALFGMGLGLSIGSRILGFMSGVYAVAAFALLVVIEARAKGARSAATRAGRFVLMLLPGLLLAYAVMGLVWPWAVLQPLNPFRAVEYFSHFFEKPWQELFGGTLIYVPDMPRSYVLTLFGLQMPEIFLLLGLGGIIAALYGAMRRDLPPRRRAVLLLVALAAIFPIALTVALRPAMYNGIRHFIYVLPPFAVLGGLAGAWLFERLRRFRLAAIAAAAVFAIGIALPVIEMVRLHPYQYTYFNRLAGGVAGARDRYMLDYWGLSFKQASQGLAAKLAAGYASKPPDRRWKLATCGPHRSPQIELGPDFEITWDPQGADFALMLGEFYCAKLDAPVLVEIGRDGVVYARVYDLRGRSYPTLLTLPGL